MIDGSKHRLRYMTWQPTRVRSLTHKPPATRISFSWTYGRCVDAAALRSYQHGALNCQHLAA